jgi:hypothetical protein
MGRAERHACGHTPHARVGRAAPSRSYEPVAGCGDHSWMNSPSTSDEPMAASKRPRPRRPEPAASRSRHRETAHKRGHRSGNLGRRLILSWFTPMFVSTPGVVRHTPRGPTVNASRRKRLVPCVSQAAAANARTRPSRSGRILASHGVVGWRVACSWIAFSMAAPAAVLSNTHQTSADAVAAAATCPSVAMKSGG